MKGGCILYEHSRSYPLFSPIRCFFHLPDRTVGISESSGLSRRRYHAACRIWAAQGEISFPIVMVLTVAAGLTGSWALYLLGRYGGNKVLGFYLRNSEAQARDRREDELSEGERMHRCICEQAAPDGAHPHLDPCRYGENGFCQIYSEFRVRDILMEPDICRGGIFLRRRGDQIIYIREGSRI